MLEVLHFIFSSFWVWFGTFMLVVAFGSCVGGILLAVRGKKDDS